MPVMPQGPLRAGRCAWCGCEQREITPYQWVYPDDEDR